MFASVACGLLFMMSYDTAEVIKQFPDEEVVCTSLSFHGDAVYIGGRGCVVQWTVITHAINRLLGYPYGLICFYSCLLGLTVFR